MKTKNIFKALLIVAVIGVTFTSCKKDRDDDDNDTTMSFDNALAEGTFNDVNNIADEAADGNLSSYFSPSNSELRGGTAGPCATITNDTTVTPKKITIDFGTSNCLCNDGRYRRGQIIVTYSGKYKDSASTHTITFNNYFVNDNQVLGSKTVTNNGHNSAGNLSFTIVVNGQIIKANNGGTISWTSNRTREWIQGEGTPQWSDDIYLITGSASGTSASNNSFTAVITKALRKEIGCKHLVSGTFTLTPQGKATRIVDFGNGACDNQANVTINGKVYNITLH